jgi:hypothetical protein
MRLQWSSKMAGMMKRSAGVVALAAAAAVAPVATAQTVAYTGNGSVGPLAPPSPTGSAPFLAQGTYDFGSLGSWDLLSTFVFNVNTGLGVGGFEFAQGGNSFSGTINTTQTTVAGLPGFEIAYAITSGTGAYTGAIGNGGGLIVLTSFDTPSSYIEAGIMNISIVPEPASALLMLGGVAALLGRRLMKRP